MQIVIERDGKVQFIVKGEISNSGRSKKKRFIATVTITEKIEIENWY